MSGKITETRTADRGRYAIDHGPNGESELTYRLQNGRMLIDHTFTRRLNAAQASPVG